MRGMEKRVLHEERRPQVRTASDILGPGIAPYCVRIEDWNTDETYFNGFFYSEPGAFNTPKSERYWMGANLATEPGFGLQRVSEYFGDTTDVAWPRQVWVRKFWTASPDTPREWSIWRIEDNNPPGMIVEYGGTLGSAPNGWMSCNGSVLNRASYPDLFGAIGTRYNTGGETGTQFRIPTASGKVIKT